ncbi:hypothetical protein B0T17DRAFT_481541, partial [Bombardia bombarda]
RRGCSFLLIILLVSTAMPSTPVSWILPLGQGAHVAGWFVADLPLACACYFHFRVASLGDGMVVGVPSFISSSTGRTVIRGGHVVRSEGGLVPSWVWLPAYYWRVALCETAGLGWVLFAGRNEYVRRAASVVVVVLAWYVGWPATPRGLPSPTETTRFMLGNPTSQSPSRREST